MTAQRKNLARREFLKGSAMALGGLAGRSANASLLCAGRPERVRIAVAGLKHDHVREVVSLALKDPKVSVVALADDDPRNKKQFEQAFGKTVRYANHRQLLDSEPLDALIVCEEFGRRGEVVIAALEAGKHVFCDKPLCTQATQWERIAKLAAEKRLEVHVDFSLRHQWARSADLLERGEIGEILSCTFSGPHALHDEWRPRWYYVPGKHGGIINDLMGHGVDLVHWITRRRFAEVLSASRACVGVPQHPGFETLGEAYCRLEGGATVFGHVDYLVPSGHTTTWRCFVVGSQGDARIDERDGMIVRRTGVAERRLGPTELRAKSPHPFADFIRVLTEGAPPLRTTAESLHCSLVTLLAQRAAETGETHVPIPGGRPPRATKQGMGN
jgi:predicted dehydrogenase